MYNCTPIALLQLLLLCVFRFFFSPVVVAAIQFQFIRIKSYMLFGILKNMDIEIPFFNAEIFKSSGMLASTDCATCCNRNQQCLNSQAYKVTDVSCVYAICIRTTNTLVYMVCLSMSTHPRVSSFFPFSYRHIGTVVAMCIYCFVFFGI